MLKEKKQAIEWKKKYPDVEILGHSNFIKIEEVKKSFESLIK